MVVQKVGVKLKVTFSFVKSTDTAVFVGYLIG